MTITFGTIFVIAAVVVLLVAGVSAARFRGRTMQTGTVAAREGRRVTCRGAVVCAEPLLSPVTQRPVLAYRLEVHVTWPDGPRARTRQIETIRRIADFVVDDGSGAMLVRPGPKVQLFPEERSFDQSRSFSLAKAVMGRPELFGPAEYPVLPDVVPGGIDRARVVEHVVPVPAQATAVGEIRAGVMVGGRYYPVWIDGTARRPWHVLTDWVLPSIGRWVLGLVRLAAQRITRKALPGPRS